MAIQSNYRAVVQFLATGSKKVVKSFGEIYKGAKKIKEAQDVQSASTKKLRGNILGYGRSLDEAIVRVGKYALAMRLLQVTLGGTVNVFRDLIKLQDQLLQLKKVLPLTADFNKFNKEAIDIVEKLGGNLEDVSRAFFMFGQQGLSSTEILGKTKAAIMGVNAANLSLEQSINAITAAQHIFAKENLSATDVIDKLVAVQANYAVTTEDLFYGLQRTGPIVAAMGGSFDQLLGLITAVTETTRKSGAEAGAAFKRILSTISRPDVITALANVGVAVKKNETEFRNIFDIIHDLNKVWSTLTDVEQSNISQLVAGVRRRDVMLAVLQAFPTAIDTEITSMASLGFAEQAQQAQLETMQNTWERLGGTLDALGNTFKPWLYDQINFVTGTLKSLLDFLKGAPSGVGKFIGSFAGFTTVIISASMFRAIFRSLSGNIFAVNAKTESLNKSLNRQATTLGIATKEWGWYDKLLFKTILLDKEGTKTTQALNATIAEGSTISAVPRGWIKTINGFIGGFGGLLVAAPLVIMAVQGVLSMFKDAGDAADEDSKKIKGLVEQLTGLRTEMRKVQDESGQMVMKPVITGFDPAKFITPKTMRNIDKIGTQVAIGYLDPKKFKKYGSQVATFMKDAGATMRKTIESGGQAVEDLREKFDKLGVPIMKDRDVLITMLAVYEGMRRAVDQTFDEIQKNVNDTSDALLDMIAKSKLSGKAITGEELFNSDAIKNWGATAQIAFRNYVKTGTNVGRILGEIDAKILDIAESTDKSLGEFEGISTAQGADMYWRDIRRQIKEGNLSIEKMVDLFNQFQIPVDVGEFMGYLRDATSEDVDALAQMTKALADLNREGNLNTSIIKVLSGQEGGMTEAERELAEIRTNIGDETFRVMLAQALWSKKLSVDRNVTKALVGSSKNLQDALNKLTERYYDQSDAINNLDLRIKKLNNTMEANIALANLRVWKGLALDIDKFTHSLSFNEKFIFSNATALKDLADKTLIARDAREKLILGIKKKGTFTETMIKGVRVASFKNLKKVLERITTEKGKHLNIDDNDIKKLIKQEEIAQINLDSSAKLLEIKKKQYAVEQLRNIVIAQYIDIEKAAGDAATKSMDTLFNSLKEGGDVVKALSDSLAAFADSLANSLLKEMERIAARRLTVEFMGTGLTDELSGAFVDGAEILREAHVRGIEDAANYLNEGFLNNSNSLVQGIDSEFNTFLDNLATILKVPAPTGTPGATPAGTPGTALGGTSGAVLTGNANASFLGLSLSDVVNQIRALSTSKSKAKSKLSKTDKTIISLLSKIAKSTISTAKDMIPVAAAAVGARVKGGKGHAGTGATFGTMIGQDVAQQEVPKIPGLGGAGLFATLGSSIMTGGITMGFSLLGGLVGSLFGGKKQDEQKQAVDMNTDMLKRNTESIDNMNRLLALQNQLINVPAGFTIPSYGGMFGGGFGGNTNTGPSNITVNISTQSNQSADEIANTVRNTLSDMYGSQMSNTASRSSRFTPV